MLLGYGGKINKSMKYIKSRDQLNEQMGRGSAILVKGAPINGKRRLYATTIIGSYEFRPGAVMLFLSNDFYRVVRREPQPNDSEMAGSPPKIKAIKIDYRSEQSLKKSLNLKTPGRISVVKNNNKTPFHWRTLKFTDVHAAIRGVDYLLNLDEYILESEDYQRPPTEEWDKFFAEIAKKTIRSVDQNSKEVMIMDTDCEVDFQDEAANGEDGVAKFDWEATFKIFDMSPWMKENLPRFKGVTQPLEVTFFFHTDMEVLVDHEEDTNYYATDVGSVDTTLESICVGPDEVVWENDDELRLLMSGLDKQKIDDSWIHNKSKAIEKPRFARGLA